MINYIDNDIVKSIYKEVLNYKSIDIMMKGCVAQYPKKILAYNLINNYEKKNDTKFTGFFKIRTDMLYSFNINNMINENTLIMYHDVFAYVPYQYLKEYYLENFKYIAYRRSKNDLSHEKCFYIDYFFKNKIPIYGCGHKNYIFPKKHKFEFSNIIIRQKRDSNEICMMQNNNNKKYELINILNKKIEFKNFIIYKGKSQTGKKYI